MMNSLLRILLICALPAVSFAQRSAPTAPLTRLDAPMPRHNLAKAVPEILEPAFVSDTCFTNRAPEPGLTAYYSEEGAFQGFVTGSNTYSDQEKIQRLVYDGDVPFVVNSVFTLLLEEQAETINEGFLYAVVYDDLTSSGVFADPIGVSDTLLVADINFDDFVEFPFSNPPTVTNDSFLVGINFSGVYADVADTTGFIGVASTIDPCGNVGNVYEKFTENGQIGYDAFGEFWTLDVELYIGAVVDSEITSTRQAAANYGTTVVPNPAQSLARLTFDGTPSAIYRGTLTDLTGRVLRQSVPVPAAGKMQIDWYLDDLTAGMYLYHIDGPAGRESGKLMVH